MKMSSGRSRRDALEFVFRLVVVVSTFAAVASQRGNPVVSWERFSRLIPTNSVYGQQDGGPSSLAAGNDAPFLRLLDENNVMDSAGKAEVRKDQQNLDDRQLPVVGKQETNPATGEIAETKRDEIDRAIPGEGNSRLENQEDESTLDETYDEDYEVDDDTDSSAEEPASSRIVDYTVDTERVSEGAKNQDDRDNPTEDRYDAYYYYDDYDNSSRSRYETIVADDDAVDYPDSESSEDMAELSSTNSSGNSVANINDKLVERDVTLKKSETTASNVSRENEDYSAAESAPNEDVLKETDNASIALDESSSTKEIDEEENLANGSVLIGEAVVSVVTTKSVVNGTISVPETTILPSLQSSHTEQISAPPTTSRESTGSSIGETDRTTEENKAESYTEDSSRILASVQTSRSISGARFLPFPVIDRVEPIDKDSNGAKKTSTFAESTESIIDKLDRVQSELSSGFLAGGFRTSGNTLQLDVLNDRATTRRRFTTTAKTPVISKFVPRRYNDRKNDYLTTTPKYKTETTLHQLEGLLPKDYAIAGKINTSERPKLPSKWPSGRTTASSETSVTKTTPRSTLPTRKNKPNVIVQDISALLPAGYKLKKEDSTATGSSLLSDILAKSKVDISSLLPSNYSKNKTDGMAKTTTSPTTTVASSPITDIFAKTKVDLTLLLPSDYAKRKNMDVAKMTGETTTAKSNAGASSQKPSIQELFANSPFDVSALLPSGYKEKTRNEAAGARKDETSATATESTVSISTETPGTTAKSAGGLKIVFPSRPGGRKPIHKITTPQSPKGEGPFAVTPRIQKGWPTRATTEFTGWPPNYTTQISIAKLVEVARTATEASINSSVIPTSSVASSTSTTTTTTTTPKPTTPGTCEEECEVAGTIRIVGNATWVPELLDRNTHEWQQLAMDLEREMNLVYSKSAILRKWYKRIRIDSFSQGSILADYFVELADLKQKVNTQELRVLFHDSLRMYNAQQWNDTKSKGTIRLGSFTIDTKFTDFVVIPKVTTPQYIEKDDRLIPQWAIAVIVIGVGGLLFIIIFGVSVLVNRQHRSKLKPSMSTIYEEEAGKNMIHANHNAPSHRSTEYQKPVTIWNDPDVSWNDKSFESTSNKVLVDRSFQDNKKYNMYDSWRSEWNGYYYNQSQGSSKYAGYDSTTNLSSRHHPDYDTNF